MKRAPLTRRTPLRAKRRPGVPVSVRAVVAARSAGRCELPRVTHDCTGVAVHLHHRLMRSQGGPDTAGNLLHVCHAGHHAIHANPARSYAEGWLIRSHEGAPND